MITDDGWLDWAERVPGPPDKVYAAPNAGIGYVPHSAVGHYGGWEQRLFSTDRREDGRYTPYAAASVHGWINYDGSVKQHYSLTASCWASGSQYPNTNFIAFENEGGFDPENEPLTPAQIEANARIIREVAAWRGWQAIKRPVDAADTTASLYEHRDCVRFGSAPTSCPSGRMPWEQILAAVGAAGTAAQPSQPPPPPAEVPPQPTMQSRPGDGRTVVVHLDTGDVAMDIDEYVRGVLPYEMATGWPMEALKAQAVAAKSYALAAGAVFPDTRSQVYGPLRFSDTDAAVEAVRGVYLAFRGQIIMPFYFGHCPSHTRSPSEAGWSAAADRPYLVGVECACGRDVYFGHGIGMCQRGAFAMAQQGANFDQILRHYYTGIELSGFDPKLQGPDPANAQIYVIVAGDTLPSIAGKFGCEWPAIYTSNQALIGPDPNVLLPGCQLVIPRAPMESGETELYIVQPGDTLFAISRKWGITVQAIAAANGITNEGLIRVGQRLKKP